MIHVTAPVKIPPQPEKKTTKNKTTTPQTIAPALRLVRYVLSEPIDRREPPFGSYLHVTGQRLTPRPQLTPPSGLDRDGKSHAKLNQVGHYFFNGGIKVAHAIFSLSTMQKQFFFGREGAAGRGVIV
jgi:hypothetical protein